jgi:hypothetical protein
VVRFQSAECSQIFCDFDFFLSTQLVREIENIHPKSLLRTIIIILSYTNSIVKPRSPKFDVNLGILDVTLDVYSY